MVAVLCDCHLTAEETDNKISAKLIDFVMIKYYGCVHIATYPTERRFQFVLLNWIM